MTDLDPEIEVMSTTSRELSKLDEKARYRVIKWLSEKFGVPILTTSNSENNTGVKVNVEGQLKLEGYQEFAELFNAFNPSSDTEKLLIGAYWSQVVEKNESWYSISINKLLKPTGHGIGKIARVLSGALKEKPAKIIQIKRIGSNPQAKKACKLTTEGISFIQSKLNS